MFLHHQWSITVHQNPHVTTIHLWAELTYLHRTVPWMQDCCILLFLLEQGQRKKMFYWYSVHLSCSSNAYLNTKLQNLDAPLLNLQKGLVQWGVIVPTGGGNVFCSASYLKYKLSATLPNLMTKMTYSAMCIVTPRNLSILICLTSLCMTRLCASMANLPYEPTGFCLLWWPQAHRGHS